jgi:hypothetical protein
MNTAQIIASLVFGSIGFAAFIYGKKLSSLKPLVIGIILMVYPYLVSNTIVLYAVGVVLTLALFIFPGG